MQTSAVVFLFNTQAQGVSDWYGGDFDPAFLRALSAADEQGLIHSSVLRGDALVSNLATKIIAASAEGNKTGHTQSVDVELYRTLIWDLTDSLVTQWHTVGEEEFPFVLGAHGLHCVAVLTLPTIFKSEVDRHLQGVNGYVGAIEIDLGNPIQRAIFVDYLIKDAVICSGRIILELSWDGSADAIFEGSEEFLPRGLSYVEYGQLEALRPVFSLPKRLSFRGADFV